ncbi:MAG TPA: Crp/Fnr family transcriptional regulator [Allosphingosinicella sp.]
MNAAVPSSLARSPATARPTLRSGKRRAASTLINSPFAPLLRKRSYRTSLGDADRTAFLRLPHTLRTIEHHRFVRREGDRPTHSCLLRSGFVLRHRTLGNGSRQIVAIHLPGDFVDLPGAILGTADYSAQAITRCEVAYLRHDALRELAFARPPIGHALWQDTLIDTSIAREWIANVGRRDSRTRIAHFLCEIALRLEAAGLGKRAAWELPLTQDQIADCTGLTAVHVNRTLRTLNVAGLVTLARRSVVIDDWSKLARAGDFSPGYLHLGEISSSDNDDGSASS